MNKLDEIDLKLIDILKENSKLSSHKISKITGIPITTVYHRIKKLEEKKIIKAYTLAVDYKKLGRPLLAYSLVYFDVNVIGTKISREELVNKLKKIPRVQHISYTTGRYDIILVFRLKDLAELNDVVMDYLRKIPGLGKTETFMVLEEVK